MTITASTVIAGEGTAFRCPGPHPDFPDGECDKLLFRYAPPIVGEIRVMCPGCRVTWRVLVRSTEV